jgi:hypothetical protein
MALENPDVSLLPLLIAAHHLGGREGAIDRALAAIDRAGRAAAWGNPNPDGYSYNGDMGAASHMQHLAWALHMLGAERLGEARRARMLEKLARQGDIFVDLALLNRDYWGGSLLQDHGRKSLTAFGIAALNLYGILPQAERWLTYALPRIDRAFDAAPRDGVIPASSYFAPRMYLDDTTWYRDALLAQTGRDVFDLPHLRPVIDYVWNVLHERDGVLLLPSNLSDRVPLEAGGVFFAQMASKFRDGRAQWLALRTLEGPRDSKLGLGAKAWSNALWSFLAFNPDAAEPVAPPSPRRNLAYFEDSGLVHYRDDTTRVHLGPPVRPAARLQRLPQSEVSLRSHHLFTRRRPLQPVDRRRAAADDARQRLQPAHRAAQRPADRRSRPVRRHRLPDVDPLDDPSRTRGAARAVGIPRPAQASCVSTCAARTRTTWTSSPTRATSSSRRGAKSSCATTSCSARRGAVVAVSDAAREWHRAGERSPLPDRHGTADFRRAG